MIPKRKGAQPLVCSSCEQVVGVIDAPALAEMLETGEVYICKECLADPATEARLALQAADYWLQLVVKALLARTLAAFDA